MKNLIKMWRQDATTRDLTNNLVALFATNDEDLGCRCHRKGVDDDVAKEERVFGRSRNWHQERKGIDEAGKNGKS